MKLFQRKDRIILCAAIVLGGITAALTAFVSILLQQIVDAATSKNIETFRELFIVMLIYLAVLGIMGFLEAYWGKRLLCNLSIHLRENIFRGVIRREPISYFSRNTADYLSALTNDIKLVEENYILPILLSSQMVILFIATLGILFYLSPVVTVILFFFLILMFLVPALLGKKMQEKQDAYSEKLARFTAKAKDYLGGYEIIRGYSMHSYIYRKFASINKDTAGKKFAADKLLAINECFSDIMSSLSIIVIVFVSAYLLLKGRITMGTLLALIQLSGTFVTPVVLLMQNFPKVTSMKPVLEHLEELSRVSDGAPVDASEQLYSFTQSLHCSHVSFGYTAEQPVLKDVTFSLEAEGKYALLGASGSGKSTLIRLLTGYSKDFEGDISYDGRSIRDMSQGEINRLVSVIYQNVFLFDADIYENICLGEEFTKDALNKALEDSGISQFLPETEAGIHTQVGENGINLSGGQRQRIAVARALIRQTPILIIDEGTSAVDKETAFEIEEKLLSKKELTILTITHHMSEELLTRYDNILEL